MSTTWIRVVFGPVFAALAAFTVIFGILMVSPGPTPPADPGLTFRQLSQSDSTGNSQNTITQQIDNFYGDAARFRNNFPAHQRNVFLAAVAFGILFALIGLGLPAAVNYLRWGLLLGALGLFIYGFWYATRTTPSVAPDASSILSLLSAGSSPHLDFAGRFLRFAVAFIGLILTLFLGLWRLTQWSAPRPAVVAPAPAPVPAAPAAPAPAQWAPPASAAVAPAAPATSTVIIEPARTETREAGEAPPTEWRRPE